MFTGCGTALVTPFARDFTVDEETLRRLIRRQIEGGIDFLVPCGTTGESPTLSRTEHLRVVEIAVEEARGKVPVLGGAGGYNTAEVITCSGTDISAWTDTLGHSLLQQAHQSGLYQHYPAIAERGPADHRV
jgi:4-hydroxy-tetrahydrodipicolinate synthase